MVDEYSWRSLVGIQEQHNWLTCEYVNQQRQHSVLLSSDVQTWDVPRHSCANLFWWSFHFARKQTKMSGCHSLNMYRQLWLIASSGRRLSRASGNWLERNTNIQRVDWKCGSFDPDIRRSAAWRRPLLPLTHLCLQCQWRISAKTRANHPSISL